METISIKGLDKADVLAALYNASKPLGFGRLHFVPGNLPVEAARERIDELKNSGWPLYFDYVKGRVLKVDLTGDGFNPWLYDRDNGVGAAKAVIDALRSNA